MNALSNHHLNDTLVRREALEAGDAVERLLRADAERCAALAEDLVRQPPQGLLTLARGSSDHAAHDMAYLTMARLGRLVTSLPMSLITLHQTRLHTEGLVSLAFSQSGQSPDLIVPTEVLGAGGARTVAFVNDGQSPLAMAARWSFGLHAGPERSVAATKSYIAQLVCGARWVAHWQQAEDPREHRLLDALASLPALLREAAGQDWSAAVEALRGADRLYVIGRGTGLPVALEAALKFKETCGIQAEAYSAAELRHGPMALVESGYPVLVFAPRGPAQAGLLALAADLRQRGARVLLAAPAGTPGSELALVPGEVEDLDPVTAVQSFYPMVEALARARGLDPDQPRHLAKVTRTH